MCDYNSLITKIIAHIAPDSYLGRVNNDINRLREGSSALDRGIGTIDASEKMITIQQSVVFTKEVDNKYVKGNEKGRNFFKEISNIDNEAWIQYEPENWIVGNSENKEKRDPVIGISHELGHAWDFIKGKRYTKTGNDNTEEKSNDETYKMLLREVKSIRFENEARSFLKVAKRTKYGRHDIIEDEEEEL